MRSLRFVTHCPSIPTALACSEARWHASAWVKPSGRKLFPPFVPVTNH
jgi:hypothetical protein